MTNSHQNPSRADFLLILAPSFTINYISLAVKPIVSKYIVSDTAAAAPTLAEFLNSSDISLPCHWKATSNHYYCIEFKKDPVEYFLEVLRNQTPRRLPRDFV